MVAPYEVRADGHVLRYDYARPDSKNTAPFPVYAEGGREAERRLTSYALHLPYTIVEHIGWGTSERLVYFFASQPAAADRCVGYCLVRATTTSNSPTTSCRSSSA